MKQIKVKILGVELESPLLNPEIAKHYEEGLLTVVKKSHQAQTCKSNSESIKMMCSSVIEFIDDVSGAGSAKRVLGDDTDLLSCLDAFEELSEIYEKQVNLLIEEKYEQVKKKAEIKDGN